MLIRMIRWLARRVGLMKPTPGAHCCWRCELYDPGDRACFVVVNRGRKDPKTGMVVLERLKTDPADFCAWRHLPPELVECADLSARGNSEPQGET